MKKGSHNQKRAFGLLLCAFVGFTFALPAFSQANQTVGANQAVDDLLGKAHTLEVRGRMDMARQKWQQVLLVDPKNTEALAGMARAAKLEGNAKDYADYLDRLKAVNPNDPNIIRIENMNTAQDSNVQLQEAGRLAQAGQYAQAMAKLHQVYGTNPPPGDAALSYYQTEAATEEGRPHAIAGLRALMDKYPQDSRYQIALGKILTYNARTREEGRRLLQKHPQDPEAVDALHQSLIWDENNIATASDIRAYLAKHPDQQLASALANTQAQARRSGRGGRPLTPEEQAAQAAYAARSAEEQAAYNALNAHRIDDAETRFKAILANNPHDWQALAGMGYVRMNQTNFGGAVSYLEQAQQEGGKDPAVERALADSRFFFTMQTATAALNQNDLVTAQQQFTAALHLRPNDPQALLALGGTLLKAQQADAALPVFASYVKMAPGDMAAWRGLFMAQYGAAKYQDALATDKRVPPKVKAQLLKDPDYLRTLASVYLALGRDADAQRVLKSALDQPFPQGGKGLQAGIQNQFAALLVTAGHKEQAVGLYRQVLNEDPNNSDAWMGLVQVEHSLGQDSVAFQLLQTMPADTYQQAMQEPGFETSVAAVYEAQGRDELAQEVLEKFLAKQQAEGRKPFISAQIELAGIYLRRGNSAQAYPLYQSIIASNPGRTDAWEGLLTAMHATGHDQEAMAELQAIPPDVRKELENDPAYLQTVGSIYAGVGQSQEAMVFLSRADQHYRSTHTVPPADIDIQTAWLLYNSHNDTGLYAQLMALGGRTDLTDQQRITVQTIWTNFAVRRANAASARGDYRRAIAILNATAKTFPGNPAVVKSLASGYASAGMPKEAVAIFKSQNLSHASAADYKAAIGAALAANDTKAAETWLRFGLDQYPNDPQMLVLAGKFEVAIGNSTRAEEYYRQSLRLQPAPDPGQGLAAELSQPLPQQPTPLPRLQSQDLATLLAQPDNTTTVSGANGAIVQQPAATRPYLPSYTGPQSAPIPVAPLPNGTGSAPPMYGSDGQPLNHSAPATPPKNPALKDYVPQSRLDGTPAADRGEDKTAVRVSLMRELHVAPGSEALYRSFVPGSAYDSHAEAESVVAEMVGISGHRNTAAIHSSFRGDGIDGVRMVAARYMQQTPVASDGTPIVGYAPVARPAQKKKPSPATQMTQAQAKAATQKQAAAHRTPQHKVAATHLAVASQKKPGATNSTAVKVEVPVPFSLPTQVQAQAQVKHAQAPAQGSARVQEQASAQTRRLARERAEAIRANQADASLITGVSRPPQESYDTAPDARLSNAQYGNSQYTAVQAPGNMVAQPATRQVVVQQGTSPSTGTGATVQQTGDSAGQQYPQPRTAGGGTGTGTGAGSGARRRTKPATTDSTPEPAPVQQASPMQYPVYPQPMSNPGYPAVGQPVPLGQAPSDYDLMQQNVPPLRAYYDPRVDANKPLTERDQTELDLANLEGSYSGWVGGSVIGRYRSGTPGVDRLAAMEVPFEASVVIGEGLRLSVIPTAVFLSSGQLNTNGGTLGTVPVLGTWYGTNTVNPPQQFASGVGGEFQLATHTFQAAIGYTPYEFLVSNVIGRLRWKPNNGHFTFFGGRDAVKETQLSYAGLRDPESATTTFSGNVWGGVVQTGGGVRFDSGNEKAGMYLQAEGADLTGYHVLDNRKYDGTMGAYFRVKTWSEYGSLNVGGTLFGEHFDHNERPESYGLGGYFSPEAYFLAAVPVTFAGHYGTNLHYSINGSVGIQTFQEDSEVYFPLDPVQEASLRTACISAAGNTTTLINQSCGVIPVNSNTGLNYAIDSEVSYHVNDHWYVGGFISGNNTNNYNTISGGFFGRYTFKAEYPTVDYPTGLFPIESTTLRPLKVP